MTATVKRGAGRPAAAARKAKHDQRNPQPSAHTTAIINDQVQSAQDSEAAMGAALNGTAYSRMTVAELAARLETLTGQPAKGRKTKGQLLNSILLMERQAENAPEQDQVRGAIRETLKDDPERLGPIEQAWAGNEPNDEAASSNAPETDADAKGAAKALKVSQALAPHGWIYGSLTGEGPRVTATFTRGIEALTVVWDAGVFNYEGTSHAIGDRITRVRNVSAALKLGARKPEEAEADLERVVRNRTFNKSKVRAEGGEAPARPRLKFDPETVTEPELFKALAGKVVVWINRISRDTESATVTTNPRNFNVLPPRPDGSRILQFTSPNGFRALRISDITRILPAGSNPRKQRDVVEAEPTEEA